MDLHVYTPDFAYLGCIDAYTSMRWRRQVFDAGEFELHCAAVEYVINLTQPENYIIRDGYEEFAVLEGRNLGAEGETGETISVTGGLGNSLLGRCVINKTYNINGPAEVAMRALVAEQMPRICPNIVLGTLQGFTEKVQTQVTYKNLLTTLSALSKSTGILFKIRADVKNGHLVFETYKGKDRATKQTKNPRVVFSDIEETLDSPKYSQNKKAYKNFAYVAGEGEGDARTIITVDRRNDGEALREMFVDAKDLRQKDLTDAQYKAQLTQRGNEKLDDAAEVQNFESSVTRESGYVYRKDWELGDIVTCHKSRWGILIDERVTEVEEVFETETGAAGEITPTFGSPYPEKLSIGG